MPERQKSKPYRALKTALENSTFTQTADKKPREMEFVSSKPNGSRSFPGCVGTQEWSSTMLVYTRAGVPKLGSHDMSWCIILSFGIFSLHYMRGFF